MVAAFCGRQEGWKARQRPNCHSSPSGSAYRAWADTQRRGRFERVGGEVVAMAPERIAHTRVNARLWQALDRAIHDAGLPCEALADGVTVEIGEDTDYEPDAVVVCGSRPKGSATAVASPVVVVEVLSPSTAALDTGRKLVDYFSLPSVMHYLITFADRQQIIHHRRGDGGEILTRIVGDVVVMSPPGIILVMDGIWE